MYSQDEMKKLGVEYSEEGEKEFAQGNIREAITLMQKAYDVFSAIDEPCELVKTLNSLGVLYSVFANDELAMDYYLKALQIAKDNEQPFFISKLYNNIGSKFQYLGEHKKAVEYFCKAQKYLRDEECKKNEKYQLLHTVIYLNLGLSCIKLGKVDEALKFIEMTKVYPEVQEDKSIEFAIKVVECMIRLEKDDIAFVDLNIDSVMIGLLAYESSSDVLQTIEVLCEVLEKMKDYDRWESSLNILDKIAEHLDDVHFNMVTAQMWSHYYLVVGDDANYQKACAKHMQFYVMYKELDEKRQANAIKMKIELHNVEQERTLAVQKSHTDPLTGAGNRNKLEMNFETILEKGEKEGTNIGLALIDIDCFKQINDTYGHLHGDECLKVCYECINRELDANAQVYRFGGDEFVVLFADCKEGMLEELGEKIKKSIGKSGIKNINSTVSPMLTVSQGFVYMECNKKIKLDSLIKYADKALYEVKKNGRDGYRVIMSGKKDYHYFYQAYKENLDKEATLENSFRLADTREDWVLNLQQRSHAMHSLYSLNEDLIARYIAPLMEGMDELDDDIAKELFEEIWNMYLEKKTDYLVMIKVGQKLEEYFAEKDMSDEHICILAMLALTYTELNQLKYSPVVMKYFEKLEIYRDYFASIENIEVRKTLCDAYFKGGLYIAEGEATTLRAALDIINRNINFFENCNVKERLGLSDIEAMHYKDRFKSSVLASQMYKIQDIGADSADYVEAFEIIEDIYNRHSSMRGNEFFISERIFGAYYVNLYLMGKISREELYNKHKEYIEYSLKYSNRDEDEYFNMMMYFVPTVFAIANSLGKEESEKYNEELDYLDTLLEKYISYIKGIPQVGNEVTIGRTLCSSLSRMLSNVSESVDVYDLLYKVIVERNVDITIHSLMVSGIAKIIVEMIYRNNALMFKGCLGLYEEDEILENWPKLVEFAQNAGKLHDIGKIDIAHITHKQTRHLTDIEFENIYMHPEYGRMIIKRSEELKEYIPIIMGHHKSYDDLSGYPSNYKYKEHGEQLIVDIIRIADSLDAATDSIGRNYAKTKSYKEAMYEMVEGKGTSYNPELVEMMITDSKFHADIEEFLTEGRVNMCYEIYNTYLEK